MITCEQTILDNPSTIMFASEELRNNKELLLKIIEKNPKSFIDASDTLKNDEEVALLAVTKSPHLLEYVSENLQKNKDFILKAVSNSPFVYKFINNELNEDREILLGAVKQFGGTILSYAKKTNNKKIGNDRELILAAFEGGFQNALDVCSNKFKNSYMDDIDFLCNATLLLSHHKNITLIDFNKWFKENSTDRVKHIVGNTHIVDFAKKHKFASDLNTELNEEFFSQKRKIKI